MNCQTFRQDAMELLEPGAGLPAHGEWAAHRASCAECARWFEGMTQTLDALQPSQTVVASDHFKERVMSRIVALESEAPRPVVRRVFGTTWWRPAFAAGALAAAALLVLVFSQPSQRSYAVEQTVEAVKGVRFIHVQIDPFGQGVSEAWAQFGEDGQPLHIRCEFPRTEDGPKTVLWEKGQAEVWFKNKKSAVVVREPNYLSRIPKDFFDPKLLVEGLYLAKVQGRATIEVMSAGPDEPITLNVTTAAAPGAREVWKVNLNTKLVEQIEKYRLTDGRYELVGRITYLEYNQPIAPETFRFDLPPDVIRVDELTQEIGLPKGALSDAQISEKVVREFFEAMIAKDYAKAGRLYGGVPGAFIQKSFGALTVLRVVSLGPTTPQPIPGVGGTRVKCEVEVEKNGVKSIESFNAAVRPVYSKPDFWAIHGGI